MLSVHTSFRISRFTTLSDSVICLRRSHSWLIAPGVIAAPDCGLIFRRTSENNTPSARSSTGWPALPGAFFRPANSNALACPTRPKWVREDRYRPVAIIEHRVIVKRPFGSRRLQKFPRSILKNEPRCLKTSLRLRQFSDVRHVHDESDIVLRLALLLVML